MLEENKSKLNIKSSFRDPCGFIFINNDSILRQVNTIYRQHYDHLMNSGLYDTLVEKKLLIPHIEIDSTGKEPGNCYKIIQPEVIPFISYAYEWSFSQLKQAALTTIEIQRIALDFGMILKDASIYNIQFKEGKPILIDTLSFEIYQEGSPWIAYRQFCQHFLAPLALMSYTDIRLSQLLKTYIDGIPLDLASKLLPFRTYFKFALLMHIHLQSKSEKHFANKSINIDSHNKIKRLSLLGIMDSLEGAVKSLKWAPCGTEWADYYGNNNYTQGAIEHKKQVVDGYLNKVHPKNIWDFGANTGTFSRIASNKDIPTISFDIDPAAVEKNYLECFNNKEKYILPLFLDLSNPTPAIGWDNQERMSIKERGPTDLLLALALVHHLAISNNVPFKKIAEFFSECCSWLIIEFVPKDDSNAKRLLVTREDIFMDYTEINFREEFDKFFLVVEDEKIKDSQRVIFLMKNRKGIE